MRAFIGFAALAGALVAASAASAAPGVDIRYAAARVTVIPEARSDVQVYVARGNDKLPLTVTRQGDQVVIEGNLHMRPESCHGAFGKQRVFILGIGDFSVDDLPQVVIRTPMDAHVSAGESVWGSVAHANSLDLRNSGCGDWTVAPVSGPLNVGVSGSGDVHANGAGWAEVHISGSGDVSLGEVRGALTTAISGSGDISAASINGPFEARVSGSGDVKVHGGRATTMNVHIAGSGDVVLKGPAQSLDASIAGSGDVSVGAVSGSVVKHVSGSGDVNVGR
jgi:hypothetical protein